MIVALQSAGKTFVMLESLVLILEDLSTLKLKEASGAVQINLTYI